MEKMQDLALWNDSSALFRSHNAAVLAIAEHVKQFYAAKRPFRIYHGSTNSTKPSQFRHDNIIDTSRMNNVLYVDVEQATVFVEPNVPMDLLVAETRKCVSLGTCCPAIHYHFAANNI